MPTHQRLTRQHAGARRQGDRVVSAAPVHAGGERQLTPASVAWLQHTAGNRAVQRLLMIQRAPDDNAEDFIEWIGKQKAYTRWSSSTRAGDCSDAAREIGTFLTDDGRFNVAYRGIIIAPPRGLDKEAVNHFVVVVTVAGSSVVIDPTQGQFQGGSAQVAVDAQWQSRMESVKVQVAFGSGLKPDRLEWQTWRMKFRDFSDFGTAKTYCSGARDYDHSKGIVIGAPPHVKKEVQCVLF